MSANFSPGDKYEGEWREGLENGMGAYTAKDGSSFQGHWLNGQMHGKGVSLLPPLTPLNPSSWFSSKLPT